MEFFDTMDFFSQVHGLSTLKSSDLKLLEYAHKELMDESKSENNEKEQVYLSLLQCTCTSAATMECMMCHCLIM